MLIKPLTISSCGSVVDPSLGNEEESFWNAHGWESPLITEFIIYYLIHKLNQTIHSCGNYQDLLSAFCKIYIFSIVKDGLNLIQFNVSLYWHGLNIVSLWVLQYFTYNALQSHNCFFVVFWLDGSNCQTSYGIWDYLNHFGSVESSVMLKRREMRIPKGVLISNQLEKV